MYYGDLGKRIIALILDSFVVTIIYWIICAITGFILGLVIGPAAVLASALIGWILAVLVPWIYQVVMEGGKWHATIGKRVMGLYVADSNGNGITYSTSILRLIGKILSGLTLGIGYLMAFFNDTKQGLHDMVAKTYVLNGQPKASYANRGYAGNANDYAYANQNAGEYERMPELVGINGPLAGMVYQIGDNGLIMGRDSVSCQVVIPDSQAKVSRTHCYVTFNPMSGMFIINDRNSTHGTFLANGSRISYAQPAALKSGGRFYLATPENTFEVR